MYTATHVCIWACVKSAFNMYTFTIRLHLVFYGVIVHDTSSGCGFLVNKKPTWAAQRKTKREDFVSRMFDVDLLG